MQIWAAAQQELQLMDICSEKLSPTAFNVLLSNNTTPMLLYNHDNDTYEDQNIPNRKTNSRKKLDELRRQFNSENTPIEVSVENKLIQTLKYGRFPLLKKIK